MRLVAVAFLAMLAACTPLGLNTASRDVTHQPPASPEILGSFGADLPITTREAWTSRRAPLLRAAFEQNVYGPVPIELDGFEVSRRIVDPDFADGAGVLEEIDIRVGRPGTAPGPDAPSFRVALALPKSANALHPAPLILGGNFCGNRTTFAAPGLSKPRTGGCGGDGLEPAVVRLLLGMYTMTGPTAEIVRRGYAYATFYPPEIAADDAAAAPADLARIAAALGPDRRSRAPAGVIAAWAGGFSWALDVMETDARIDHAREAVYGHSREGKAALLAAAFDPRIDAVIAHQPGKGGGTLTRAFAGESVKQITASYPHWFAPAYAAFADRENEAPVDQHELLALVAPRPMLLGNGWNDVWSDPNGAFRAAIGATPVYQLLGPKGLTQTRLDDVRARGDIDWWIRPGAHGVRKADWAHFLDFLDAKFGKPALQAPGVDALHPLGRSCSARYASR